MLIKRLYLLSFTFLLLFSPALGTETVLGQADCDDPQTPEHELCTPTATWEPLYKTPTPAPTNNYACPSGTPVGLGTITPDIGWSMNCSNCLQSLTPWPTGTAIATMPWQASQTAAYFQTQTATATATATNTPTITPTATQIADYCTISFVQELSPNNPTCLTGWSTSRNGVNTAGIINTSYGPGSCDWGGWESPANKFSLTHSALSPTQHIYIQLNVNGTPGNMNWSTTRSGYAWPYLKFRTGSGGWTCRPDTNSPGPASCTIDVYNVSAGPSDLQVGYFFGQGHRDFRPPNAAQNFVANWSIVISGQCVQQPSVTATPTATVTATPSGLFCSVMTGSTSGSPSSIGLGDMVDGITLGTSTCLEIPGFTWDLETINWLTGWSLEEISFPGLRVCLREISFGQVRLFQMAFDLDVLAFLMGAVLVVRMMIRS